MAQWGRVKQYGGTGAKFPQVASAATVSLPENRSIFDITGTTGITTLSSSMRILPGRVVTLTSTDGTGAALTDTAASTAASANGTISLSAAFTVKLGSNITLIQQNNGQWHEMARAVNG